MDWNEIISSKIYSSREKLKADVETWKGFNDVVVFTNGCFDILHMGHLDYLAKAAELGDRLIVALNTDQSVSTLKGPSRPVIDEATRSMKMAAFSFVDAVVLFDEETPLNLIEQLKPDILVKGGDYTLETIVGAETVMNNGGQVEVIPFLEGHSTSNIINKILND